MARIDALASLRYITSNCNKQLLPRSTKGARVHQAYIVLLLVELWLSRPSHARPSAIRRSSPQVVAMATALATKRKGSPVALSEGDIAPKRARTGEDTAAQDHDVVGSTSSIAEGKAGSGSSPLGMRAGPDTEEGAADARRLSDASGGDVAPQRPSPEAQVAHVHKASADFKQEERSRGRRLFGGLLSTLNQSTVHSGQQRKRIEAERRQLERARQERVEAEERRRQLLDGPEARRKRDQSDEQVVRTPQITECHGLAISQMRQALGDR